MPDYRYVEIRIDDSEPWTIDSSFPITIDHQALAIVVTPSGQITSIRSIGNNITGSRQIADTITTTRQLV